MIPKYLLNWLVIKIETYWNVNSSKLITYFLASFIKIETYWNVNKLMVGSAESLAPH